MKLSSLKVDLQREQDGDWVDVPDFPGVSLKVRAITSAGYSMALNEQAQKLTRRYAGRIPPDVSVRLNGKLLAEHILLDWEGFDQPYSRELADELLRNPEYRKLSNAVVWAAQRIADTDEQPE